MYYTYVWFREDGTPYYVGKGKGKRGFTSENHRFKCPPKERIVTYPAKTEDEAYDTEVVLVWYYGRKDLGTGCLRNLTDGGDRPPDHRGMKRSKKSCRLMSQRKVEYLRNNPRKGIPCSTAKRDKISLKLKGHVPWNKGLTKK
jgi:hypothetical protein